MKDKIIGALWILGSLALPVLAGIFFTEWIDTAGVVFSILMLILAVGFAVLGIVHAIKTYFTKW